MAPEKATLAVAAVTVEELRAVTRLLEAVVADRSLLAQLSGEERQALVVAAGRIVHAEPAQKRKLVRALRSEVVARAQAHDRALRATAGIRAARETPVFEAPARELTIGFQRRGELGAGPAGATSEHGPSSAPAPPGFQLRAPLGAGPAAHGPPSAPRELKRPRTCYVCKQPYTRLHSFYDAMCPACGDFNYEKRFQTVPLDGRVAVVTGARVKIGYQAALKLLRSGATVVAVTRFPHDAAKRYAAEPDYTAWSERLRIHGLDLRHAPSVELFCRYLLHELPRLDLLVNNACQTVRRPPGFYEHLLADELQPLPALPAALHGPLRAHHDCVSTLAGSPRLAAKSHEGDGGLVAWSGGGPGLGLRASAQLSQVRYAFDDDARREDLFPSERRDADLQQVDLRGTNTWRQTLSEVETAEMIEVQLVNAVAPFVLCGKLKPLMLRTPGRDKHVVNVSAMEGIFSRGTKTARHPHTNMAKAGLNMMTLTSAREYVEDGIHMNAVDTGWVTDEDPFVHAERKKTELGFEPPLDIVDGAARILDPFIDGLATGEHVWGKFLKDYKPSSW